MYSDKISASQVKHWLHTHAYEAKSGYNDGWTAMSHKRQLWEIKCALDDMYEKLPVFVGEEDWEKERLMEILKK